MRILVGSCDFPVENRVQCAPVSGGLFEGVFGVSAYAVSRT